MNRLAIALAVIGFAAQASAFDNSLCTNAGSPVPGFAKGRDSAGCLMIDPGNGDAAIRFNWEANTPGKLIPANACPTNDCGYVAWNVNADDFAGNVSGVSGGDAYHFAGRHYKWILWKNFGAGNTWKCKGGSWPPCGGGTSNGHNDAMQIRGQPVNNGWAVMQDSVIANANDIHMILEMSGDQEYVGPAPGFVFQGVKVGYFPDWGEADNWTADCQAMGGGQICGAPAGGSARWQVGSNSTDTTFKATWLIDSVSHVRVEADRTAKLIVVNTGCSNATMSCGGQIGYENGWPAPLGHAFSSKGPGTCPNGLLPSGNVRTSDGPNPVPVYCYTSLERALADGHERPPFLQISNSGWQTPPAPGDAPPAPPQLLP